MELLKLHHVCMVVLLTIPFSGTNFVIHVLITTFNFGNIYMLCSHTWIFKSYVLRDIVISGVFPLFSFFFLFFFYREISCCFNFFLSGDLPLFSIFPILLHFTSSIGLPLCAVRNMILLAGALCIKDGVFIFSYREIFRCFPFFLSGDLQLFSDREISHCFHFCLYSSV